LRGQGWITSKRARAKTLRRVCSKLYLLTDID
jgi:hypothetical protein